MRATLTNICSISDDMHRHSAIVNIVAHCAIALNLGLWSRTRKEIQCTHFEHFTTLLQTSEYKIFNMKQHLSSMGLVRKLLFALQVDWYSQDVLVPLFEALKVAARASLDKEDTIERGLYSPPHCLAGLRRTPDRTVVWKIVKFHS